MVVVARALVLEAGVGRDAPKGLSPAWAGGRGRGRAVGPGKGDDAPRPRVALARSPADSMRSLLSHSIPAMRPAAIALKRPRAGGLEGRQAGHPDGRPPLFSRAPEQAVTEPLVALSDLHCEIIRGRGQCPKDQGGQ